MRRIRRTWATYGGASPCLRTWTASAASTSCAPPEETWAVNYLNGIYQYVKYGYVLQFDGQKTKAVYSLDDRLMKHNLLGKTPKQKEMEKELKAIIQQYMERMTQNRLTPNL